MKKSILLLSMAVFFSSCGVNPKVNSEYVREIGDSLIVNTSVPGAEHIGYNGPVPLEVVVVKGKIADIRVLPNSETPRYQSRAMYGLKEKWVGKTLKKATSTKVDAVSGATYTSKAIIANMEIALAQLQKE